jgi:hypothetical protein
MSFLLSRCHIRLRVVAALQRQISKLFHLNLNFVQVQSYSIVATAIVH